MTLKRVLRQYIKCPIASQTVFLTNHIIPKYNWIITQKYRVS